MKIKKDKNVLILGKSINFLEITKEQCYQYQIKHNYFRDLFSSDMQNEIGDSDLNYTLAHSATCLNDPLTEAEVRLAIRKLKIGKSPGSDEIAAEFFKQTSTLIVPVTTYYLLIFLIVHKSQKAGRKVYVRYIKSIHMTIPTISAEYL